MSENEHLLEAAIKAIDELFSDRSVSVEKALENMEELQSDIDGKIEGLKSDLEREAR